MTRARNPLLRLLGLLLLALGLSFAPAARADDVADLLARLEAAGARVVRVAPGDARLRDGRITTSVTPAGTVEVYVPEGGRGHLTPLRTPTERMSVAEHRELTEAIRAAVRRLYGIELRQVYITGSSSGLPFREPGSGTLRTFDRQGPGTSDYDGALVSPELFEVVRRERPDAIRGANTGLRTAPAPLPALAAELAVVGDRYGRKLAGMIYASEAELAKRLELTGGRIGVGGNHMPEPPPDATHVEPTRAELVGALIEAELLRGLLTTRSPEAVRELLERARSGEPGAADELRAARRAAAEAVRARGGLGEVDTATVVNEARRLAAPSAFAPARPAPGPAPAADTDAAARLFEAVRAASAARALERAATLPEAARADARAAAERARLTSLEVVPSADLALEWVPESNRVRVTSGLLARIEASGDPAFRAKALALLFGHELAHAAGVASERVADAEAVRAAGRARDVEPLAPADLRATVRLFTASGEGRLADALYALRSLPRHGTAGARASAMEEALAGAPDRLASYRRADGTLDWRRLTADRALQHGAGVAHFALALFLKELAVVVQTGDRARIDEFFDGLLTTDFFVNYGLFSAGAHAGNVAYAKFLGRYVKPRFVSGVLRTNVAIATGMALSEIVRGHFDGRTFAINVASLGLSSAAVKAGLRGISWVVDLSRVPRGSALLRSARLRHLARLGGWFYTAAETAVVLYFGDEIAQAVTRWADERDARAALGDATRAFAEALADPALGPEAFEERLDAFTRAHTDWRNFLFRPLAEAEAVYQGRLARAARAAKLVSDQRAALAERLERLPALRARMVARHGSVEAYLDAQVADEAAEVERDVVAAIESYERARREHLAAIYGEGRREGGYLGAATFTSPRARLAAAARGVSENRLQAYDDEAEALAAAHATAQGDPARSLALEAAIERNREARARDAALFDLEHADATGALGRLREATGQ